MVLAVLLCHQSQWATGQPDGAQGRAYGPASEEPIAGLLFHRAAVGSTLWIHHPEASSMTPADAIDRAIAAPERLGVVVTYDESTVLRALRRVLDGSISAVDLQIWRWEVGDGTAPTWRRLALTPDVRVDGIAGMWRQASEEAYAVMTSRTSYLERVAAASPTAFPKVITSIADHFFLGFDHQTVDCAHTVDGVRCGRERREHPIGWSQ